MGAVTTAAMIGLTAAGAAGQAVSAHKQAMTARRAETRAKNIARAEKERQAEIAAIQTAKETEQAKQFRAQQRLAASGRIGRRSLLTGSALGVQSTLG
jgi:hypothetical protein